MKLSVLFLIFSLGFLPLKAQTLIGFSADLGNKVVYESNYSTQWLSSPQSITGTLYFIREEAMKNNIFLRYGANVGVLGHKVRRQEFVDTIRGNYLGPIRTIPNYHTIYAGFEIGIGKSIYIPTIKQNILLIPQLGMTYYFKSEFRTATYITNQSTVPVFSIRTTSYGDVVNPFIGFSMLALPIEKLQIGISYKYHFKPPLEGNYEFGHTETKAGGTVVVNHRVVSLIFMYKIKH